MAAPLATNSISLTGGGTGLVTSPAGSIRPDRVEGLILDDVRVVSRWAVEVHDAVLLPVGRERTGPSSDRLLATVTRSGGHGPIDPIGLLERRREVTADGMFETLRLTTYVRPAACTIAIRFERDDLTVFDLGGPIASSATSIDLTPLVDGTPHVALDAPGWRREPGRVEFDVELAPGSDWTASVAVLRAECRPTSPVVGVPKVPTTTMPDLTAALRCAADDLAALHHRVGAADVVVAGSPYFLALFGRDSLVAGLQQLLGGTDVLGGVLTALAAHQATTHDPITRAQPGRILHELRLGAAGVFGVAPGTPYYGAVDTPALFGVALGEAARWGVDRSTIAHLLPYARAALDWCSTWGDVDGDGFVESVPDPNGLTNLGWKDSGDSMVDRDGRTHVGSVALAEVQAYWYRALLTCAALERWLGIGDGLELDRDASALRERFLDRFVYDHVDGAFVGLALDADKRLLDVRTSNAGHVLWCGLLPPDLAASVSRQLTGDAMFSGWGVRTLAADEAGYNPFGYHLGSVWPHDSAIAMLGAARYGDTASVAAIANGLVDLAIAGRGQLPELLSGISRTGAGFPVPYAAACRPQAWSAGAPFMVAQALLGLEPDAVSGTVLVNPCLPDDHELEVRDLRFGSGTLSVKVRGHEVVDALCDTAEVRVGARWTLDRAPTPRCVTTRETRPRVD